MERHIGLWTNENGNDPAVAELIIDGNHIEFYRRNTDGVFARAYVGGDGEHRYKVFTKGIAERGKYKTLNIATSCKTFYVLQQNCEYQKGMNIEGILSASFCVPELVDWIGKHSVELRATEEDEMIAIENKFPNVVLKESNPKVEIYFERSHSLFDATFDDRTTIAISNKPRIKITYTESANINILHNDIRAVMQFLGLMIGHITDVIDIRLDIQNQDMTSRLYINDDFSYNLRTMDIMDRPRTKFINLLDNIQSYFEKWYSFYYDDKFELVRRMYFEGNKRKNIYAQDILVQYVRILEGYHLRITEEEKIATTLEKDIKQMIFTDEGKKLFAPIFSKADWEFNSKHSKAVASWIASGFLMRTSLSQRLKLLDEKFFDIIAQNSEDVERLEKTAAEGNITEERQFNYYQRIVDTRNYYSHYKTDDAKILNFNQVCQTINVLKALIIMILYTHMGMSNEEARKIIIWDTELHFQTMCLRKDGEKPNEE